MQLASLLFRCFMQRCDMPCYVVGLQYCVYILVYNLLLTRYAVHCMRYITQYILCSVLLGHVTAGTIRCHVFCCDYFLMHHEVRRKWFLDKTFLFLVEQFLCVERFSASIGQGLFQKSCFNDFFRIQNQTKSKVTRNEWIGNSQK